MPRWLVRLYYGLGIVAGVIVAAYLAWNILVPEPDTADTPPVASPAPTQTADPAETLNPSEAPVDPYQRKEECWTFLLVGKDKVGANTDSLMYLTYNVKDQTVSVASIPRDTRMEVDRSNKKINAAFASGGMEELRTEVARTLGIPVDYYIKVDVKAFVQIIDWVGGIDFEVPCNMNYDDPAQDLHIHYKKGMQHLTGQQALEVCRFRDNNDGTGYYDQGRMETQRAVLATVAKKALSWGSLTKINEFVDIIMDNVETDLTLSNMLWFASKAVYFDMENLHTETLPAEWYSPYMWLDPQGVLDIVNQYLNPYTTDRTLSQLSIARRT